MRFVVVAVMLGVMVVDGRKVESPRGAKQTMKMAQMDKANHFNLAAIDTAAHEQEIRAAEHQREINTNTVVRTRWFETWSREERAWVGAWTGAAVSFTRARLRVVRAWVCSRRPNAEKPYPLAVGALSRRAANHRERGGGGGRVYTQTVQYRRHMDGIKLYFKLKGMWNETRDVDPPFDSLDHERPRAEFNEREDVSICVPVTL
jgi:hypothetical protein